MMLPQDTWQCYDRQGRKLADVKPDYVLCKEIQVKPDNLSLTGETIEPPKTKK
jgi:hypothetical protein